MPPRVLASGPKPCGGKNVKANNRNDDPSWCTLDQYSDLIGFTYKMKKIKAEVDTTFFLVFSKETL